MVQPSIDQENLPKKMLVIYLQDYDKADLVTR